jgi:hypothetical protein
MAISITQSSQIEFADWLGVIGTTRRRGNVLFFHKIRANPRLKSNLLRFFSLESSSLVRSVISKSTL